MFDAIISAGFAASSAAANTAGEGGPTAISVLTYAWVFGISILGGIASFYRKMKDGHVRPFNLNELAGECFISGFVGVVTFFACKALAINEMGSAAIIGITSHMGARGIFLVEQFVARWVAARAPVPAQAFPDMPKDTAP